MAQLQFNIDEVKEIVVVDPVSGNKRPMGVDFPNGVCWRKPVILDIPPAPVASCHYMLGNTVLGTVGEHTGSETGITDTPRWHDPINTLVNLPYDWGHNAVTHHEQVTTDLSSGSSSSQTGSASFTASRSTLPALWCITSASYSSSSGRFTANLEIYNPGLRTVSWDICDSKGNSVGSSIVSGWPYGSLQRSLGAKERTSIKISCTPNKLFPNGIYNASNTQGSEFSIKFTDLYSLADSNSTIYADDTNFQTEAAAVIPLVTSSQSKSFRLMYYSSSGLKVIDDQPRVSALPTEVRTIPYSSTKDQPFVTMYNPFSVRINYSVYASGYYQDTPKQARELCWGQVDSGKLKTFAVQETDAMGIQSVNYYVYNDLFAKFEFKFRTDSGTMSTAQLVGVVALPRQLYPPVITRVDSTPATGNYGAGSTITLQVYNPNPIQAVFEGSLYTSDTVSYSWPGTVTLAPYGSHKVTLTLNKTGGYASGLSIEFGGELSTRSLESGAAIVSRTEVYKVTLYDLAEPTLSKGTLTQGGLHLTFKNDASYSITCRISLTYWVNEIYTDPVTGKEEARGHWDSSKHITQIAPKSSRTLFFADPNDSGFSDLSCYAAFMAESRFPTKNKKLSVNIY